MKSRFRRSGTAVIRPTLVDGLALAVGLDEGARHALRCTGGDVEPEPAAALVVEAVQARVPPVRQYNGRLAWDDDVTVRIYPPVAGRVAKVLAEVGAQVTAGQPLAVIDSPDFGQAQADARALASSISIYSAHMGSLPTALTDLTSAVSNSQGQVAGPFMASIPAGPAGWGTYVYTPVASAGTFTVSNSGDSTSVSVP